MKKNKCPTKKKAYHTFEAARWFGKLGRLLVYKCPLCGMYHNSSQAKKKVEVEL